MSSESLPKYEPKKIKVKKGEALWLLSFSDLSMILISFFILQLSYSTIDKKKAEIVQEAMETKPTKNDNNLKALQEKIEKEVQRNGLQASAKVTYDVDGLSVEFKDNLLFDAGSAESNPAFQKVVGSVMNVIADTPAKYRLFFEGHTDDTPVVGGRFPSNWELSAARGITLMRHFQRRGVNAERMSVTAYAETKPMIPTKGLRGKYLQAARAANRRVVIRIE